jgi:hypothetical protein
MMLSETSQWHITMPVGGGIHAINKATLQSHHATVSVVQYCSAFYRPLVKGGFHFQGKPHDRKPKPQSAA